MLFKAKLYSWLAQRSRESDDLGLSQVFPYVSKESTEAKRRQGYSSDLRSSLRWIIQDDDRRIFARLDRGGQLEIIDISDELARPPRCRGICKMNGHGISLHYRLAVTVDKPG
jgi:hypothetical protein